jgi:hypothetical protein
MLSSTALTPVFLDILSRKQRPQSVLMFLDSKQPIRPASAWRWVPTPEWPFTRHGNNLDELQHLAEMGLSPQEAIRVATLDSARLLKLDD